ncbi:MAG: TetR/AcrR family transcriptional regulator C-terminal domain-containing protein, partial [Acidimicrobiia bacterium]|nr:TetR/AcrR family transcriptional regulator C-terminal domain-containing protein [Acidimicrobiia bacterium]
GFTAADALQAVLAIGNYVIGDALESQSLRSRTPHPRDAQAALLLKTGVAPTMLSAATVVFFSGDVDRVFEAGLSWLIEGLRHQIGERPGQYEEPAAEQVGEPV